MKRFLETWRSSIPLSHAKAIEKELKDRQSRGELTSTLDFSNAFKRLVGETQKTNSFSTRFKLIPVKAEEKISSELQNHYVLQIGSEIQTLLNEINNISNIIDSHKASFADNKIPTIESILQQLESQIATYELLAGITNNYNYVQFNDFTNRQDRETNRDNDLFTDPVTGFQFTPDYDCNIEEAEGDLVPPTDPNLSIEYAPINVSIVESMSNMGDFSLSPFGGPQNLLTDTPWVYSIFNLIPQDTPTVAIEFKFNVLTEVNYITLTPATDIPLRVKELYFLSGSETPVSLSVDNTNLLEQDLSQQVTFTFKPIYTTALIVVLEQPSYQNSVVGSGQRREISSHHSDLNNQRNNNHFASFRSPGITGEASFVPFKKTVAISNALSDEPIMYGNTIPINENVIGNTFPTLPPTFTTTQLGAANNSFFSMAEYKFGIGKVESGLRAYKEFGIFVSKALKVPQLNVMNLQTKSQIPLHQVQDLGKLWNIEYYLNLTHFTKEGEKIGNQYFPILPYTTTRILGERIHLDNNRIAQLRFNAISPTTEFGENDIVLKRNGLELIKDVDYEILSGVEEGATRLKLLVDSNLAIVTGHIYTVDYTPDFLYSKNVNGDYLYDSETNDLKKFYLDKAHQLWYRQDGLIEYNPFGVNLVSDYTEVTCIIIMRSNYHLNKNTALLNQYQLFLGGIEVENTA